MFFPPCLKYNWYKTNICSQRKAEQHWKTRMIPFCDLRDTNYVTLPRSSIYNWREYLATSSVTKLRDKKH